MTENFEGHPDRECGEHRTLGGRAWCHDCSEYCYPDGGGCRGCELPGLRTQLAALKPVLVAARKIEASTNDAELQDAADEVCDALADLDRETNADA